MPLFISNINHHINTADSVTSFYKTVHFNPGCFHDSGYGYVGTSTHTTSTEPIESVKDEGGRLVKELEECARSCPLNVEIDCQFWTFNTDFQNMGAEARCRHLSSVTERFPQSGVISGPRACGSYGASYHFLFSLAVDCVNT